MWDSEESIIIMSSVKNLGCVFFLYFPKSLDQYLQIPKFCAKKNFALWIELSTELNQNRSFQALNIWPKILWLHQTSNETCMQHQKKHLHEVHRKLPLYISFRTSLLFLSYAEFVDDIGEIYPTGSSCMDSISCLLKCVPSVIKYVMDQMFNSVLVFSCWFSICTSCNTCKVWYAGMSIVLQMYTSFILRKFLTFK